MVTMRRCCSCPAALSAFGSSTSTPFCIMGAVTMKMMRKASTTSTKVVTLMSARLARALLRAGERATPCISGCLLESVQDLGDEVVQPVADHPKPVVEVVVSEHRRDGRREACGGGDQRFGDPGGHGCEIGRADHSDRSKGAHDAPHRAEKPDKGSRRCRGGQKAKVPLEASHRLRGGRRHGAL